MVLEGRLKIRLSQKPCPITSRILIPEPVEAAKTLGVQVGVVEQVLTEKVTV